MSYHPYPIVYHIDEFILSTKEAVYQNLLKEQQYYIAKGKQIQNFRDHMLNEMDVLLNSLDPAENSLKKDNMIEMKLLIEQSTNSMFGFLRSFQIQTDWLSANISNTDEASKKRWWEIADQFSSHEEIFKMCLASVYRVTKIFIGITDDYVQFDLA